MSAVRARGAGTAVLAGATGEWTSAMGGRAGRRTGGPAAGRAALRAGGRTGARKRACVAHVAATGTATQGQAATQRAHDRRSCTHVFTAQCCTHRTAARRKPRYTVVFAIAVFTPGTHGYGIRIKKIPVTAGNIALARARFVGDRVCRLRRANRADRIGEIPVRGIRRRGRPFRVRDTVFFFPDFFGN